YTTGGVFGQFREMAGGSAHVLIETVDARPASFIIADTPKSQAASLLRLTQARLLTSAETITSSAEVEPPGPQQVSPQHPLEAAPETFLFSGERLTNAVAPHPAQPSGLDWRELDDDVIQSKFIMTIATAGDTGAAEVEPPMASSHSYTSSSNTDQRTVGKRRARHGLMRNPLVGQSVEIDRLSAGNKADASHSVSSREMVTSYETSTPRLFTPTIAVQAADPVVGDGSVDLSQFRTVRVVGRKSHKTTKPQISDISSSPETTQQPLTPTASIAAHRVRMQWSLLTYVFTDKQVEAAFQAQVCDVTIEKVSWSLVGELMSTASLIVLCFIDSLKTIAYDAPLIWAICGAVIAILTLAYLTITQSVKTILVPRVLHTLVQVCFVVCIFAAPSGTVLGDSQMIWPIVSLNLNLNRPFCAVWYVQFAQDVAVFVAFFCRTYFIFTIPTPSSMYTVTLFLEAVFVVVAFAYRLIVDINQRNTFAAAKQLELLKEEIAGDYQRLHDALEVTIPEGIAGRLVTKARNRSEHIAVKQRVHPIWSTSFGTSTDETPFVVVELASDVELGDVSCARELEPTVLTAHGALDAANAQADAPAAALLHIKAKMDMVTSLNALCKRGFEGRVQCMKATDNVILFCATPSQRAKSGPSKGRLLPPDEQRASDVLSFAVRATRILRAQQHASVAGGGVAVHHRVVVGSGYLMG
ncbi:transmembrane protein, putative, partial [Bodo saltans]